VEEEEEEEEVVVVVIEVRSRWCAKVDGIRASERVGCAGW
jgi:hypothetical protein